MARLAAMPVTELDALLPVLEMVTTVPATPARALGEQPAGMGLGLFQGTSSTPRPSRATARCCATGCCRWSPSASSSSCALRRQRPRVRLQGHSKAYRMLHEAGI